MAELLGLSSHKYPLHRRQPFESASYASFISTAQNVFPTRNRSSFVCMHSQSLNMYTKFLPSYRKPAFTTADLTIKPLLDNCTA